MAVYSCVLVGATADARATTARAARAPLTASSARQGITLEKIMSDPDWIGAAVNDAYWSADGRAVYYSVKRNGSPIVDLHRIDLADHKDQVIEPKAMAAADARAVFDAAGKRAAFARNGDIFVRDVAGGRLTQITRTPESEAAPQFSADGRLLSFRVNNDWYVHDFGNGLTTPAAVVKAEKDPAAPPKPDDLRDMQMHTFSTLQRLHDESAASRKNAEELRRGDVTRAAAPFYLGEDVSIRDTELSPDARWLVVVTVPKSAAKGFEGKLTRYVTESGYEEFEPERLRVGRNPPAPQSLLLLNLVDHTVHALGVDSLPGIGDDPLKAIREENGTREVQADVSGGKSPKPRQRTVTTMSDDPDGGAGGIVWSPDGKALAIQFLSMDNKDRWIASVDFARYALVPQHRLSDSAWINWTLNEFGWLKDSRTLWYESEESGYAHVYTKALNAEPRALTEGRFEVSDPVLSADGRWFYVLSNAQAPYSYDVYRVPSGGGKLQRVTQLQGVEKFALDQRGKDLLVTHSTPYVPAQLAVLKADGFSDVELFGPHAQPDGDFPNVPGHVANPENPAVFDSIIERGRPPGISAAAGAAIRGLALIPLSRVVALGLPLRDGSDAAGLLVVALLVGFAALALAPAVGVNRRTLFAVNLPLSHLRAALAGLVLGLVVYLLGAPVLWSAGAAGDRVLLGLVAAACAAVVEELVFRGVVQITLQRAAGRVSHHRWRSRQR